MLDKSKRKRFDTRLIVLWTLYIIKFVFCLTVLKTGNQLYIFVLCTFTPMLIYQGIQGYRIQLMLEYDYPEILSAYPKLSNISTRLFIRKRIIKEIKDPILQKELIFLRRFRQLSIIWMYSYLLYDYVINFW